MHTENITQASEGLLVAEQLLANRAQFEQFLRHFGVTLDSAKAEVPFLAHADILSRLGVAASEYGAAVQRLANEAVIGIGTAASMVDAFALSLPALSSRWSRTCAETELRQSLRRLRVLASDDDAIAPEYVIEFGEILTTVELAASVVTK